MCLTQEQLRATHAQERAVCLSAGAGSGKTRTLVARIRWLIETQVILTPALVSRLGPRRLAASVCCHPPPRRRGVGGGGGSKGGGGGVRACCCGLSICRCVVGWWVGGWWWWWWWWWWQQRGRRGGQGLLLFYLQVCGCRRVMRWGATDGKGQHRIKICMGEWEGQCEGSDDPRPRSPPFWRQVACAAPRRSTPNLQASSC